METLYRNRPLWGCEEPLPYVGQTGHTVRDGNFSTSTGFKTGGTIRKETSSPQREYAQSIHVVYEIKERKEYFCSVKYYDVRTGLDDQGERGGRTEKWNRDLPSPGN